MKLILRWLFLAVGATAMAATAMAAAAADSVDWPTVGGQLDSSRYSPLAQVDATNVANLAVAWRWQSPDDEIVKAHKVLPFGYKVTPLVIDDVMYVSTSLGLVAALDAATGRQLWVFDTGSWKLGRPTNLGFNHRGVAYWRDGDDARIFMPNNHGYLWSIDAVTGKPDAAFGEGGRIDLTQGLGRPVDRKQYSVISAPIVIAGGVVVGSSIMDGPRTLEMPPGHVRSFDVRTGNQKWIFHTIPQAGEFGVETWENDAWKVAGNTNVWTMMSADPELGYLYLPTGTPTNDWYGGHRLGDNLFAESLICVDAATGKRVWHFQMVHHGLWDYDLPAAPLLVDVVVDGRPIRAVAQVSKQGYMYVFDRVNGAPVWPIEERPVPQSTMPGERSSPTQPHPTRPAPFDLQGISDEVLVNYTPELHAQAQAIIAKYDHGPLFTPPSLKGTINLPGWGGGANWYGAAFDPESGMIYVPSMTGPMVVQLQKPDPARSEFRYARGRGSRGLAGPDGLPLTRPPYARITAIDLGTGEHAWMVPNGRGDRVRAKLAELGIDDPGAVGAPGGTGPLLTKTLLLLGHRGDSEPVLRAFSKASGAVLAEVVLPGRPQGTPMTWMTGGRQYIGMAIGQANEAAVIALALPGPALQAGVAAEPLTSR